MNLLKNTKVINSKIHRRVLIMEKKVLNIKETAEYLGISRSLAYKLANDHVIPVIRLGTRWIVPKEQLDQFIQQQ